LKPLLFNDLKFHLHYDIIYYGIVAQDSMTEDSAQRMLQDVKDQVNKLYKGNVAYMMK
jgi:hypothetical protein